MMRNNIIMKMRARVIFFPAKSNYEKVNAWKIAVEYHESLAPLILSV